ncbi:D-alanyl-D-alanine carboxypeptidase family protein [Paenibacillus sp. 481]|nr:D-alanyl-D-alanine carboxypeptidase family protein [Paenibacillus sp. 481]
METISTNRHICKTPIAKVDNLQLELRLDQADVHQGHLILVNYEHPIRSSEQFVVSVNHLPILETEQQNIFLEKTCAYQLAALLSACQVRDEIVVVSGYRSRKEQQELYTTSLRDNGPIFTTSYVARPNESEHQTGLAVDVGENAPHMNLICPSFPDHGVYRTFKQLAATYGFIQRYQQGKEHITHIACEPWHYRYVGFPHSVIMEQRGLCLEEYLTWLKQYALHEEHLYFEHKDLVIEIYYVRAKELVTTVPITNGKRYEISGNNDDGFVVTVFHEKGSEGSGC